MKKLFASLVILGVIAGCASTDKQQPAEVTESKATPPAETKGAPPPPSKVETTPVQPPKVTGDPLDPLNPASMLYKQRSVFFDYDSTVVKDEYKPLVTAHSRYLSSNRNQKVTIEGNTDERGSREYNLALGQKRSEAVRKALGLLGVSDNQLEAVSFGKEKPADPGQGEAAFAKNRRVEIEIVGTSKQ